MILRRPGESRGPVRFLKLKTWIPAFAGMTLLLPVFGDSNLSGHIIAIDPGHGTLDYNGRIINSGRISKDGKYVEHRLNFQIAKKIGDAIESAGGRVVYTRTPFDYWRQASSVTEDNRARALLANELKAEVFIAIHCDWDPRSRVRGVTTYYKTQESKNLGDHVHAMLVKGTEAVDRHVRHDRFTVLDQVSIPAVLIESGFLSNRGEAKKLATPEYQAKIGDAVAAGLSSYFSN